VQKRKPGVPGSPMGQQQLRAAARAKGRRMLAGLAATGASAMRASASRTGRGSGRGWTMAGAGCGGVAATTRSGGRVGLRPAATGRTAAGSRRMGLGRGESCSRCALPTTEFFETPMRRPISAVECPSDHRTRRRSIASDVQSIWMPPVLEYHMQ